MRNRLKYGVPAAAGLATGGYALSQGEDPGSAGLAAIAGGLGGGAGLLGARNFALAGKYGGALAQKGQNVLGGLEDRLARASYGAKNDLVSDALLNAASATGAVANQVTPRNIGKVMAAGAVPASAGLAGLGGVALGGAIGATGMPGFQQQGIVDPEAYQSSNMPSARQSIPTLQYR
jgi:hypothetical protein